jgi:tetratricopeptide (TPR) repeat protein
MAYVRRRGNQVLIVHGERDRESRKVEQRVLFTIYSKAEAREALAQLGRPGGGSFGDLLQEAHPDVRLDWARIREGLQDLLGVLPDEYDTKEERVRSRFRHGLTSFARQLMLADPQDLLTSARLIQENRLELEWLADLIRWRVGLSDQKETEWNRDDPFHWRFHSLSLEVPADVEEMGAELWERRELDRAEAVFRLIIGCFDAYADGFNYLGLIALEREHLEEAIALFEKTMEVGRRLFPRRIARSLYWSDHRTRPYMRGMGNLALALNRAGRWDEALVVCDRLERECGDRITAMAHRGAVWINTERWAEAAGAALYLRGIHPEESLVAGFAQLEAGRPREALVSFLHGALNQPRAAHLLVGCRRGAPRNGRDADDHNAGVELLKQLHTYFHARARRAQRFFSRVLALPGVGALLSEVEDLARQWFGQPKADRAIFERLNRMKTLDFARERAAEIGPALGLPEEPTAAPEPRRRRGAAVARVH